MIEPSDDLFHRRNDNPYWNESAWFGFSMPEHNRHGFIHFYHRPNMGYTVTNIGLWDPSGETQADCLYYNYDLTAIDPYGQMFDFASESGLRVSCLEPLRSYRLRYGAEGCEFDLTFTAVMEPHATGFPTGMEEYGKGHYEHGGKLAGSIEIDGDVVEVDAWCDRDHSWGARRVVNNPRGAFHWALASEGNGFHINAVTDLKPADDPIFGTTEPVISGYYLRDGVVGTVSGGELMTERSPDGRPQRVHIRADDGLGRELRAEGRPTNWFDMYWHSFPLFQWWSSMNWTFDGCDGTGEIQDYFTTWQTRRFLRSLRSTP